MKISKTFPLFVIAMVLGLSACGGGNSGGQPVSAAPPAAPVVPATPEPAPAPVALSFKEVTYDLLNANEDSEPMDMAAVNMNADADDDENAFSGLFSSITN